MRLIRAFAESTSKPITVYNLAQIPPPASPSPMPPPGQPTELTVTLTPADGKMSLRWKCSNPPGAAGTSYIVRRRPAGESDFHFARRARGRCQTLQRLESKKDFVDDTLSFGPGVREGIHAPAAACSTPCRASDQTRADR